jgi:hypothetical protein
MENERPILSKAFGFKRYFVQVFPNLILIGVMAAVKSKAEMQEPIIRLNYHGVAKLLQFLAHALKFVWRDSSSPIFHHEIVEPGHPLYYAKSTIRGVLKKDGERSVQLLMEKQSGSR